MTLCECSQAVIQTIALLLAGPSAGSFFMHSALDGKEPMPGLLAPAFR